jgi:RNA polymerase sigma-70 factor (ECF subfamily)
LFHIAGNLARNYHRDRGRKPEVSLTARHDGAEREIMSGAAAADHHIERHQERAALRRAVADLPPRQRAVVTWRIDHDLPFSEIAEVEGITENNAKVTFCHAVKNLKQALAGQSAGDGEGRET